MVLSPLSIPERTRPFIYLVQPRSFLVMPCTKVYICVLMVRRPKTRTDHDIEEFFRTSTAIPIGSHSAHLWDGDALAGVDLKQTPKVEGDQRGMRSTTPPARSLAKDLLKGGSFEKYRKSS